MELINQIIENPLASIAIIGNLVIIESLLSVDNAAVLATMVLDLPVNQRGKALKYGIVGAYIFRGAAMLFAAYLIKIWWLKPLGGLYLIYLFYSFCKSKFTQKTENETINKYENPLFKATVGVIGNFWATVCLIEIMDMAFSIDNVFAAIAFTPNIILVCLGVFIGIFTMRFISQWFVTLMEKYSFLETAAFIVIGILGIKLSFSILEHFYPQALFTQFLESRNADIATSVLTIAIFFIPVITSVLFNFPKKAQQSNK